ncbi:MAG: MFS transporter [Chloroflexaceae bacterium]|nr:MFS transporter [Chloroflexaceae bacterium]
MRVLRWSLVGLAISELAFVLVDSFIVLLGIRFVQGLLLPAAFTSVMTFISGTAHSTRLRRSMSIYVAATIVGGYLGRLLAGLGASLFDWRLFFVVLAAALLVCLALLGRLYVPTRLETPRPRPGDAVAILRDPTYLSTYVSIFCLFLVFAGLLNFLPFRLHVLMPGLSSSITGLIYTGYLLGVATSLGSGRIAALVGNEQRTMIIGFGGYMLALLSTLVPNVGVLFGGLFLFCGSMFLVHSLATGSVNQRAAQHRGIVNGLYVTFYYSGGVTGSYLPGFVYEHVGWPAFVLLLLGVAGLGIGALLIGQKYTNLLLTTPR